MKKLLLLSLAVAGAANLALADDDYTWGGAQRFKDGYNLTLEWACLDRVGDATVRQGTGANDKFYLNEFGTKNVHVYGAKGFEQTLTMPDYCWVSNTADDAGHVLIRTCKLVWPAHQQPMYPGCYYAADGHMLQIIDSKTDKIIGAVDMADGYDGRFDAIGHVRGNVVEDTWELTVVSDGSQYQGGDWIYEGLESLGYEGFIVKVQPPFANTGAGAPKTTGTCQLIDEAEDGTPLMAMYPNPVYNITGSSLTIDRGPADGEKEKVTLGNGIMLYQYSWVGEDEDDEDGAYMWNFAGKYFVTPQHASNNGFVVFNLAGKEYIVYTSGESGGAIAADALAISEVRYTDTPESDDELDKAALVYRLFPSTTEDGKFKHKASSFYTNLNVEAVEGEPNSVYIYAFTEGAPMLKLKFTAPEEGGVQGVTVAEEGEAEFFNLQGIRVANPANGVYIMRQGNRATKVIR